MAIVTISHEIGAGGPEIGQQVAERLGYHYVDQELISDAAPALRAARGEALAPRRVEALALRALRRRDPPLHHGDADRALRVRRAGPRGADGARRPVAPAGHPPRAARAGDGARSTSGSSGSPRSWPGRWASRPNPRTVTSMVRRDDTEKAGRMRYLYEVDIADPALYDLVINTEKLSIDAAVELVAGVVGSAGAADDAGGHAARGRPLARLAGAGGAGHQPGDAQVPHHGGGQEPAW